MKVGQRKRALADSAQTGFKIKKCPPTLEAISGENEIQKILQKK
jgi:hypothetical protein